MKILDLSLKYKFYDDIEAGVKPEEYREYKEFYFNRFFKTWYRNLLGGVTFTGHRHYDAVRFHRGQGSRTTMLVECKGITIGYGNPEWGAPTDRVVFIIKLGKRLQ